MSLQERAESATNRIDPRDRPAFIEGYHHCFANDPVVKQMYTALKASNSHDSECPGQAAGIACECSFEIVEEALGAYERELKEEGK